MTTIRSISLAHPLRARGASHTYLSTEKGWSFALAEPWIVVRHAETLDAEWLVPAAIALVERDRAPTPKRSKPSELERKGAPVGAGAPSAVVSGHPVPVVGSPCPVRLGPPERKTDNAVRNTRASAEPSDTNEMRALHAQVFGDGSERD